MSEKMRVDLSGKVVLITGGGNEIGKAMAVEFAKNGATVCAVDTCDECLAKTKKACQDVGKDCTTVVADVRKNEDIDRLIKETVEKCGEISILCNNASVTETPEGHKYFWEYDDELFNNCVDTELRAIYYVSKKAVPYMIKNGSGAVINTCSVNGYAPSRFNCGFAAAMGGVFNMTKAMGLELGAHNIRANAIAPAAICSPETEKQFYAEKARADAIVRHVPLKRTGKPEEVASLACFLASDDAAYINCQIYGVDGGFGVGFARDF